MRDAEAERQQQQLETWKMQRPDSICAERRRSGSADSSPPPPPRGGAIHAAATGLSQRKRGVARWLGPRQYPAKMSGGLDKTDYNRLIHLVSQNSPP